MAAESEREGSETGRDPDLAVECRKQALKAEGYALDLVAVRQRTVHEMTSKLRSKGYDDSVVAGLVERMLRAGYLDDRRFAELWIEERCRHRPSGPALLRQELRQKGVSADLVREVLTETLPPERETVLAVRAAAAKTRLWGRNPCRADLTQVKARLWDFLRRRGFGGQACQEALRAVSGPPDEWFEAGEEEPAAEDGPAGERQEGSRGTRRDARKDSTGRSSLTSRQSKG